MCDIWIYILLIYKYTVRDIHVCAWHVNIHVWKWRVRHFGGIPPKTCNTGRLSKQRICVTCEYIYACNAHLQFVTYMYMCDVWIYICVTDKYAWHMHIHMRDMYIYSSWLYMYMCDVWIYICVTNKYAWHMHIHMRDIYIYSSWRVCICVTYGYTYVWQIYSSWPILICVIYEYTCVWYINMQFVTHMYMCDIWIYICVTK